MTLPRTYTIEEFLTWPEQKPSLELIHGSVRVKSMPDFPHSEVQGEIVFALRLWSKSNGGFTLPEQRFVLRVGDETHTLLPDVAWLPQEQATNLVEGPLRVSPTLAVEVLSPRDRYGDVQEKVLLYLEAGVQIVWIVDPVARNVSVYHPGSALTLVITRGSLQDPVLPGLILPLGDLFARLPPDERQVQPKVQE
ncbi:MAG: Uma2 family endonuclease [Candidatus Xenobia bacterium]